jgi:signal transduction histidine kinase
MIYLIALKYFILLVALIIGILLIALRDRQKRNGRANIHAYATCLILAAISFTIISLGVNSQIVLVLNIIINIVMVYLPVFVFTYMLSQILHSQRLTFRFIFIPIVVPVLLLGMFYAQQVQSFLFTSNGLTQNFQVISSVDVWEWLVLMYSIGILMASLILTISTSSFNSLKSFKVGSMIVMICAITAAIILDGLSFTNLVPLINTYELMLLGFALIGLAILIANSKFPNMTFITRDELFYNITDGMIIVSNEDKILDLNPAAEQLIGIPTHKAFGNPIDNVLTNWSSISGTNDAKEMEFRGSINLNKQWRQINVRVKNLDAERGKLIILRDITVRKGADENRQHAREEMFNLLRSFFRSANMILSTTVFFRDVLFQIAYTFRVDSGSFYMVDSSIDAAKLNFVMKTKFGPLMEEKELISSLVDTLDFSKWILGGFEPIVIPELGKEARFANVSERFKNNSLALFPLIFDTQPLGVLILGRENKAGFQSDEIVRLTIVTEELASYIYSDRKRKADIALTERHRLAQDLHDSITQKLYGLVTLTEATKLGLASGSAVDASSMVDKISVNARQALREMRLFLYELEPVDIAKDGLISKIQQRLASVEGRSDIQARMIANTEISLSTEKETEIYYIVEESLNNILKHGNANSVQIKFKKRKESICIEIIDDGRGFNPKDVELGGKGLANMKDRARRIDGKLRITSSPGKGTKISLVVPQ